VAEALIKEQPMLAKQLLLTLLTDHLEEDSLRDSALFVMDRLSSEEVPGE
jgi:hypothetical protein